MSAGAPVRSPVSKATLSLPAAKVLLYLVELLARGGGYRLRGVHGWADPGEIERHSRTWAVSDLMRTQVRRGRVLAHDARPPGENRPLWLYRISQAGVDCLAESVGVWPAGVREPHPGGDPHVFLREGPVRAWQALVLASNPCVPCTREWVAEEPGWRSARELNALLASEDEAAGRTGRSFWSEDLRWMLTHRFADERVVERTHVYKLTEAGARLRPLEWQDPRG
jgi:hypothetical protein